LCASFKYDMAPSTLFGFHFPVVQRRTGNSSLFPTVPAMHYVHKEYDRNALFLGAGCGILSNFASAGATLLIQDT
jgi:hypothetical protein